jgi:hypothetical protein
MLVITITLGEAAENEYQSQITKELRLENGHTAFHHIMTTLLRYFPSSHPSKGNIATSLMSHSNHIVGLINYGDYSRAQTTVTELVNSIVPNFVKSISIKYNY